MGRPTFSAGFSLLEVMVALLITLLAVQALSRGIGIAMNTADGTALWEQAVSRAESHLAAIEDPGLVAAEQNGDDGDGYHWQSRVALIGTVAAPHTAGRGRWMSGTCLYSIAVAISWTDGRGPHRYDLASARLGTVRSLPP